MNEWMAKPRAGDADKQNERAKNKLKISDIM